MFGTKKKKESLSDLLAEFMIYPQLVGHINKAQSLQKLGRIAEAGQVLVDANRMVTDYLSENPREKRAHMMLVLFHTETDMPEQAEPIIERLLNSREFQLTDEEKLILESQLQKIRREHPNIHKGTERPSGFTQIYCCANCGRLHNFLSMPCPHCDWSPQTVKETSASMVLSNTYIKVPALLMLAREMANGRTAEEVVPNLNDSANVIINDGSQKPLVEKILFMLRENEHKNHRSLSIIRGCSGCGSRILFSGAEECQKCGELVSWPNAIRTLTCMDNLLWLFEQRVEVSSTDEFSDFVCILVAMTNNLLRKQESPSIRERQYSLQLLASIGRICDLNKGAVIETKNPNELKIFLVKDCMREDSESFGLFLLKELEFFVTTMTNGVHH